MTAPFHLPTATSVPYVEFNPSFFHWAIGIAPTVHVDGDDLRDSMYFVLYISMYLMQYSGAVAEPAV